MLNDWHIIGLRLAGGIPQRNALQMHEAKNYILESLGFEPDPFEEKQSPAASERTKSVPTDEPGYVYVLTNPSLPSMVKIGLTRLTVDVRVKQLSRSTSIPTPFEVAASFATSTPGAHEAQIHELLAAHRKPGREFFAITADEAIAACQQVIGIAA